MKKILLAISLAVMVSSCGENVFFKEWNTPYGTAPFSQIKESDYIPAVKEGIKQQKEAIEAIKACPEAPTFENTIAPFEKSGALLSRVA